MSDELRAAASEVMRKANVVLLDDASAEFVSAAALAKAYLAEHPADDAEPLSEEWLHAVGFELGTLQASLLIPPICPDAAIAELILHCDQFGWSASLIQGLPSGDDQRVRDDHVTLTSLPDTMTRGHIRGLARALGIALKEPK